MRRFFLTAVLLASSCFVAKAAVQFEDFQTPSGNIHCQWASDDGLRCDLLQFTGKRLPKPKDCILDWGDSFFVAATKKSSGVCHGDTVMNPKNPKLAYGKTWSRGGITCDSMERGLRCVNRDGHGFELSKAAAKLF
jgi:hypothetical protein